MSFFKDFTHSLSMQGRAIGFIASNNLQWILLVPLILFALLLIVGFIFVGDLLEVFVQSWETNSVLNSIDFLVPLLNIFARLIFFVILGIWGGYVVVILMSPFLAYVSERTERILLGNDYPFDLWQIIKDALRGILLAIRNVFMELLIGFLLLICGWLPIAGWILVPTLGTVLMFCVSAYFYGFSFIDYTNERQRLSISESVQIVRKMKFASIGHGFCFALILCIPIVGTALSTIMAVISTVASTIDMVERRDFA